MRVASIVRSIAYLCLKQAGKKKGANGSRSQREHQSTVYAPGRRCGTLVPRQMTPPSVELPRRNPTAASRPSGAGTLVDLFKSTVSSFFASAMIAPLLAVTPSRLFSQPGITSRALVSLFQVRRTMKVSYYSIPVSVSVNLGCVML